MLVLNGLEEEIKSISLINVLGQNVLSLKDITADQAKNGIQISSLSTGTYIIQIKTESMSGAKKSHLLSGFFVS